MRKTAILMAATMALVAFVPVGYATSNDDGHLSRTFLWEGSIEFKPHSTNPEDGIGGLGWYHPDERDELCMFRLFGTNIGVGFYYYGVPKPRVTFNGPNVQLASVPEVGVEGGLADTLCPFAVEEGQFLGWSAFNVWVSPTVAQSHFTLCHKTFALCNPNPGTAMWHLYDCNGYDGTGVTGSKKNENRITFGKGDIVGITDINLNPLVKDLLADALELVTGDPATGNPTIGASHVDSGCDPAVNSGVKVFNVTSYLNPQLNNLTSLSPHVHLDQIVTQNTTYVVSCFSIEYDRFPPIPNQPGPYLASSHDWFLVLSLSDPENWPAALWYHEQAPTAPGSKKYDDKQPDSLAEQGLYDLSGQNGCPADGDGDEPDDKPKSDDLLPFLP